MSLAARQPEYYTMDDINNLPEGKRAELIDGELYMMAAPGRLHQRFVKNLTYLIEDYIRRKQGDCEIYPAPFAVFLNADDRIYVEPDISVICDKEKLTEEGCKGAPDWIIEVVSPTSRPMDAPPLPRTAEPTQTRLQDNRNTRQRRILCRRKQE